MKNKEKFLVAVLVLVVLAVGIVVGISSKDSYPAEISGEEIVLDASLKNMTVDSDLSVPHGVRIYSISDKGIELYWKTPETSDGYVVFRSYEENGEYEQIALVEGQSSFQYFDTDYDTDKRTVYYRVAAYQQKDGDYVLSELSDLMTAKYRTKLIIRKKAAYIFSGTERIVSAYYGWGNAKNVTWTSSDPSVATVAQDGTVTALSKGTVKITCHSEELGMSASTSITVDREDEEMLTKEISHRYTLGEDGIYVNEAAEKTNDAVIMMVGDLMALSPTLKACYSEENGYNFNACYDYVKDVLAQSDLAVGNLETMITSECSYSNEEPYINRKPVANAPATILDALCYAGFDGLSLSNNHNADCGTKGIFSTLETIDKYGFARTGIFNTAEDTRYMIFDVNGIRVGYVSYSCESPGFNGKEADWAKEDIDTMLNYYSQEKASADLKAMKDAGAEYCIAYMHWGNQNFLTTTEPQEKTSVEVANLGFDYIAGGHSHTLQRYAEIETDDGRTVPCIYSMGNFNSHMNQIDGNRDSVLMRIRLQRNENGEVVLAENNYIPFYTYSSHNGNPFVTIPLDPAFNGGMTTLHKQEDFISRIKSQVGDEIEAYSTEN